MLKRLSIFLVLAFLIAGGTGFSQQTAQTGMEWKIVKELDLKATPLDVSSSADGRWLFILTPGEILVYSVPEDKTTAKIPVGEEFDRIASLPRSDGVSISSSARKTLQLILFERVHQIDVSGLPFKGAADAPIIVAVFTDYQ